jgi:CHAT domain-containing protein
MRILCTAAWLLCLCAYLGAQPAQSEHFNDLINQGRAALERRETRIAIQYADEALTMAENDTQRATAWLLQADVLYRQANHQDAVQAYSKATDMMAVNSIFSDSLIVQVYLRMAQSAMRCSQYSQGQLAVKKALPLQIKREGENSVLTSRLLCELAELIINSPGQEYPEDILLRAKNANAFAPKPDPMAESRILHLWAMIFVDRDEYARGDSLYQISLNLIFDENDSFRKNLHLGVAYYTMGERYQLEGFGYKAKDQLDDYARVNKIAENCFRKAIYYRTITMGEEAETTLWSWANLCRTIVPQRRYKDQLMVSDTFLQKVRFDPNNLRGSLYTTQVLNVIEHRLLAQYELYKSGEKQYATEAIKTCRITIQLLDYDANRIEREYEKNRYVRRSAERYELIAEVLNHIDTEEARQLLFEVSERSKSYLLNHAKVQRQAMHFSGVPDALVQAETRLRQQILDVEMDAGLTRQDGASDPEIRERYSSELATLYLRYDSIKSQIRTQVPSYFDLALNPKVITLQEAQAILQPQQTLLEYFVLHQYTYIFVINKDNYHIERISSGKQLRPLVQQLRSGLYDYHTYSGQRPDTLYQACSDKYAAAATALYKILIEPVKNRLATELLIVPDASLGYLPFEVLLSQTPEKTTRYASHAYLLRDYPISYCYSATLQRLMQNNAGAGTDALSYLGVAPQFEEANNSANATTERQRSLQNLRPLKYNQSEVSAGQQIWGGDVQMGTAATKSAFMSAAPRYRIIHLATHGKAQDKVGDYSFLAFAGEKPAKDPSILYSMELYSIQLPADMVILSACETGIGELRRGEGIISLARAFVFAGAKSVFTTLWSVDDAKSQELIGTFQRQLKNGQPKHAALRQAKLDYLTQYRGEEAHPYYWAGYIGVGDMRALR